MQTCAGIVNTPESRLGARRRIMRTESAWQSVRALGARIAGNVRVQAVGVGVMFLVALYLSGEPMV